METARQLRADVRALVIKRVQEDPDSKAQLAHALEVPESSVERMLTRETWDLDLALTSAEALGMALRVSDR